MATNKWTLEAVNERLKAAKLGVAIRTRGDRLSLRATLPPKPGSEKLEWHQQSISLGIYANPAGLASAEAEAKLLGGRIASRQFDWGQYIDVPDPEKKLDSQYWIAEFEKNYFDRLGRNPKTENTWKSDYQSAFKLLSGELTSSSLVAAACSTDANTRKRKIVCAKLRAIALLAGITVDLSPYTGSYGASAVEPRYIPSAAEIIEARSRFDSRPDWQWLYGVLATYGLRPHEAFFVQILPEPPHICKVLEGKTGSREIYPFHPQWAIDWELAQVQVPPVSGRTYKELGSRVTRTFSDKKLLFTPYCLRHAFCIRLSTEYKIPTVIAADWTGHDPAVFLRIYNRWIGEAEKRRVFEESVKKVYPSS